MLFIIKAFGVYLLIAFAMAGAALGGKTILSDSMLQSSWRVLIFAFAAALIFACYGMGKLVRNWQRSSFCRPMRIIINNKAVTVDALIDTGNDLREPVTQRPAVIAELHALSALFPQQIFAMLEQYASKEPHKVIELCGNELWRRRFCLLPYNSIGGSGILLGVRPDIVMIEGDEGVYTDEVIICFYGGHIAADNSARAIINPAVLTLPNIFETKRVS